MDWTRRAALGAAAALAWPRQGRADDAVHFPFRLTRNRPWTPVQFRVDGEPYAFMIDTGAGGFGVANAVAEGAKLQRLGKAQVQAAVGRTSEAVFHADNVIIGATIRERDIYLIGISRPLPETISGIVPTARFAVMGLDFDTQQVTMSRSLGDNPEGYFPLELIVKDTLFGSVDRMGSNSRSIEAQEMLDLRPLVAAEFDGEPVKLLIDTGATGLILFPDYVKKRGLWDHYAKTTPVGLETLATVTPGRLARAERLKVGRVVFANPIVHLADPAMSNQDGAYVAAGVIGMEYLRRLNLIVDPKRRRVWLKPNAAISDGYHYDRVGVEIERDGEGPRVVSLAPGAPAARAGLRLGDKVTGWRGRDGLAGLRWALTGAPGSRIEIQVERDGKPEMIAVVLEERV